MSDALARLARAISHHWKRSLAIAIGVIVLLGVAAGAGGKAADDFEVPGAESQQAVDLFRAHAKALAGADSTLVFSVKDGKITDAGPKAAVQGALAQVEKLPGVASVADPFARGGQLSPDRTLASVDVRYDIEPTDIEKEDGEKLEDAARTAEKDGVSVAMRGIVVDTAAQQEAPVGELVGVAIAIILLTLLFRSKAAMGATLLGAILGVAVGQILLAALAKPLGLPEFATTIAVMLGLGAGIDYALLIVSRYREQAAEGDSVRDAVGKAAATAGSSVVAAGLIVMVAIAGLLVIGIPMIGKMGVGAAIGVAAVVISALTVLPIFLGAFAKWLRPAKRAHVEPSRAFRAWGERVTRRPWLSIGAGVALLLIFAAPMLHMRLGQPDDGNQPADKTQRIAYDQLTKAFGPGSNGPFLIAVDTPGGYQANAAPVAKLRDAVAGDRGIVKQGVVAVPSEDGRIATIFATPTSAPQDEKTTKTLERLRDDVIPAATEGTPIAGKAYVGGQTAGFQDFSDKVSRGLPLFFAVVIGLSVLLLMAAFRSFWIPLASAVFNLLSIGAAYGAVTAVFQDGVGASLIGADSGVPIVSFIPVMLFAILFGLSMDYNVFLLSRMHEAYKEGDGPRESVINGMARIGKVVLFAGLVMASVFLAFVTQDDVIGKMFGVGLGLAILIDVLIVRLLIAPAVVTLLGDKAWWMPKWMDRLIPNVSLEGHLVKNVDPKGEPVQ
ncbi:MMPL family transporter [Patulibacter brassicae]|uniref:MMPL family transporter n=1 Tax=Patulibacter brassicae TaxID=1705717 RepID=A0ABU4VIH3_9ACTN|nr:MMPL family transporter [Patulibacter brassicae]MDX8151627.1 MMPL family transporter [Patulibacter brassicae]